MAQFGDLQTKVLPLRCGGTLVFDRNGNVLHYVAVRVTQERRIGLVDYAEYLARRGRMARLTRGNARDTNHHKRIEERLRTGSRNRAWR